MRILTGAVLIALFASACTDNDRVEIVQAPIIGGTPATIGQYPTVVAVLVENGWAGLCTGTLVGPDLVLTAAHCVDPRLLGYSNQAQVTAATTVVFDNTADAYDTSRGRTIQAAATIPNPQFGGENDLGHDDIALVRLTQSVTDRDPTPINRLHDDAPTGVVATLVGYGMTNPNDDNSAGTQYVLSAKPSIACSFWGNDSLLLCFDQSNGSGICSGDSGGPAFVQVDGQLKVAGVTSFSDYNCTQAGAHTRVDAELDFLDANAPELACQADALCTEECGKDGLPIDPDCPTCEADDDCGNPDQQCVGGFCVAKPNTPGGLGYECVDSDSCDSGLCATDGDAHLCSDECDPAASACPNGFDCRPVGDGGACWPADGGGGCDVSDTGSPLSGGALIGLFLLMIGGRRRRSTRA